MVTIVNLTHEQEDKIVTDALKETIDSILADPWPMYHDLGKSLDDLNAFLRVLEYYVRPSEYKEYIKTLDYSKLSVKENMQKSTFMEVRITEDQLKYLVSIDLSFLSEM